MTFTNFNFQLSSFSTRIRFLDLCQTAGVAALTQSRLNTDDERCIGRKSPKNEMVQVGEQGHVIHYRWSTRRSWSSASEKCVEWFTGLSPPFWTRLSKQLLKCISSSKKQDWEDVVGPLQQTKAKDWNIKAIKDQKHIYRWWDICLDEKCVCVEGLLQMCKLVLLLLITVISEIQHD